MVGFMSRLFGGGRRPNSAEKPSQSVSLQVLFTDPLKLDAAQMTRALRAYDTKTKSGRCVIEKNEGAKSVLARFEWGNDAVQIMGLDLPMPNRIVEACIATVDYPQIIKQRARNHQSHARLSYIGQAKSLRDRYYALAAVAGVLSQHGGIIAVNESALTSLPAEQLARSPKADAEDDQFEELAKLPLLHLFCGFSKLDVPGSDSHWFRTYGATAFGMPNLATRSDKADVAASTFSLFSKVFEHVRAGRLKLSAGITLQIEPGVLLRFREPTVKEPFLLDETTLLVSEFVHVADRIT